MSNINNLIPVIVLVLFPMTVYFIYKCYKEINGKYDIMIWRISLLTSLYLALRYGNLDNNYLGLLLTNIPIVVSFYREKLYYGIFLMFLILVYCFIVFKISILTIILKYLCYIFLYLFFKYKKINNDYFLEGIIVIQGFFITFEFFLNNTHLDFLSFMEIVIGVILFYILTFVIIYLYSYIDKITSLHQQLHQLENAKIIKDSLFKLTHEIKNPLTVCNGYLSMLDLDDNRKIKKYLPIISHEIKRSLNIISDFVDYNKINLHKEIIDINVLLEDVYNDFKLLVNNQNIKFIFSNSNQEYLINGDYNRLKQVLINIIKNAMEAIDKTGEIKMKCFSKNNKLLIEVIDNGKGMSNDDLAKINEMFFTTKPNGTGIGVPLSREIIRSHDGKIKYFSQVNKGTKVMISLNLLKE